MNKIFISYLHNLVDTKFEVLNSLIKCFQIFSHYSEIFATVKSSIKYGVYDIILIDAHIGYKNQQYINQFL